MVRIALTGGIACGKSKVAEYLRDAGVDTLDADDIVHEILPDAQERRRLAAEVFGNEEKRRALEARLHPLVRARLDQWALAAGGGLKIEIIPLLYETGWERAYDIVGCVKSPREVQIDRMMKSRGYTEEEALSRIGAQMDVEEKAAKADFVIDNSGTLEALRERTQEFVEFLKERT